VATHSIAADVSAADWLVADLDTFAESVRSFVPSGFAAYVRIGDGDDGLSEDGARRLASVLGLHTATPDRCWFAV